MWFFLRVIFCKFCKQMHFMHGSQSWCILNDCQQQQEKNWFTRGIVSGNKHNITWQERKLDADVWRWHNIISIKEIIPKPIPFFFADVCFYFTFQKPPDWELHPSGGKEQDHEQAVLWQWGRSVEAPSGPPREVGEWLSLCWITSLKKRARGDRNILGSWKKKRD